MTKHHTCKWHDCSQLKPYKPGIFRRFIMWMTAEPYDKMVTGPAYIKINPDFFWKGGLISCEYTDVYGDTQVEEVKITTCLTIDMVIIRFTKPVVMPDVRENVYLKTNI